MRVRHLPRHLLVARPWRSRTGRLLHRTLDAAADGAMSRDRDPPLPAPAGRIELARLVERTARSGKRVLVGKLGLGRVIVVPGDELDRHGDRPGVVYVLPGQMAAASTVAAMPRLR
jgi:hypothetical protein